MACGVVIPARLDSKRLPKKLLADLGGKTVLQRTYEQVKKAQGICSITILTDSEEIAEVAKGFGAHVLMTSSLPSSGTERIIEAVFRYPHLPRLLINVQGDEPFIAPALIEKIAQLLKERPNEVITAATPITDTQQWHSPQVVKVVIDAHQRALYFSRAPIPYARDNAMPWMPLKHIGIYGYSKQLLKRLAALPQVPLAQIEQLEQLQWLFWNIPISVHVGCYDTLGIDTAEDLALARQRIA